MAVRQAARVSVCQRARRRHTQYVDALYCWLIFDTLILIGYVSILPLMPPCHIDDSHVIYMIHVSYDATAPPLRESYAAMMPTATPFNIVAGLRRYCR